MHGLSVIRAGWFRFFSVLGFLVALGIGGLIVPGNFMQTARMKIFPQTPVSTEAHPSSPDSFTNREGSSTTLPGNGGDGRGTQTGNSTEIPNSTDTALESFRSRCARPGVIVCQGFDSAAVFAPGVWPRTGFYYEKDCPTWPRPCVQQDMTIAFSGASSARWDIYGKTSENAEGNWFQLFPQTFGENSTFYVQYAFRADPNWVSFDWTQTGPHGDNTAPKISIFHNHVASCAAEEITIHDHNSWSTPTGYTDCGANQLTTKLDGVTYTSKGDFLIQQGFTAPAPFTGENCQWGNDVPSGTCFKIRPNAWYTLYFKIHVGNWGKPDSSVEAWYAPQGLGMRKFINVPGYTLNKDKGVPGFDALTLTQFMTGKKASAAHPTAHVWYDELIVSSEPIPAPAGATP